jgi:hypothetical protein
MPVDYSVALTLGLELRLHEQRFGLLLENRSVIGASSSPGGSSTRLPGSESSTHPA